MAAGLVSYLLPILVTYIFIDYFEPKPVFHYDVSLFLYMVLFVSIKEFDKLEGSLAVYFACAAWENQTLF